MGLTQITTGGVDDNINIDSNTLKVDGTNNRVGIGTAAPTASLHVSANDPAIYIQDANSTGNGINSTIQYRDSSNTQVAYFGYASGSDSHFSLFNKLSGGGLIFGTNSSERLRIGNDGKVYFGDFSSIAAAGYIEKVIGGDFELNIVASRSTAVNRAIRFFSRSNQESMRIDTSGRLGIGNTTMSSFTGNASDNLVVGSGSGSEGITVYSGTTGQGAISFADGTSGDAAYRGAVEYNHTNDRLAFRTAGTGNRMVIDSSGRVLIGTSTSPSGGDGHSQNAPLLVQGRIGNDADSGRINLQRGSAASDGSSIGTISFTDSSNNAYARLEVEADAATGSSDYPGRIKFSTTADGASSPTERMRLGSDGKLLVGSDTGSVHGDRLLQVGKTDRSQTYVSITSSTSGVGGLLFADTTTNDTGGYRGQIRYAHSSDSMDFRTGATERMRIDSSGRLLINNTSATQNHPLQVKSSANTAEAILIIARASDNIGELSFFGSDNSTRQGEIQYRADHANIRHRSGDLRFCTGGVTERMRIDSSGRVGIGEASPSSYDSGARNLVVGSTSNTGILIKAGTSSYSNLYFGDGTGSASYRGYVAYNHNGDTLRLGTDGTERVRVDSSGRMMVGLTSTPSSASLTTLTGGNSSSYAYMFIAGGSTSNYKMLKAGGKFLTRNTAERNIDLVQAVQCTGNMNILITVKFKLNSATTGHSGEILCQADMHAASSGNWAYGVKTPQLTMHFGSGYGAGSLSWVGGGTNNKILRYSTDSNVNYTNYMIEEIVITGYDNANTTLL